MYYVMSDLHGCYNQLEQALKKWDKENERLVIMGDLIDRGPDSLKVVRKMMELKETYPDNVTVLKGNHEEMLLAWLIGTDVELYGFYYTLTHEETLKSFLGDSFGKLSRQKRAEQMVRDFKPELRFMRDLPLYFETEKAIFVHAGINLDVSNWRTAKDDLTWIRNEFIYSQKTPEKRVFFGHTPTVHMHKREVDSEDSFFNMNSIWISDDKMKVGIDGAASMGGQLNVLRVNEEGEITEQLKFK